MSRRKCEFKHARDLEKLLDQGTPGLPIAARVSKLLFHFVNSVPEQLSLTNFTPTLVLVRDNRKAVQIMSEQLLSEDNNTARNLYDALKPGHQCRIRPQVESFNCGDFGHCAKDFWNQGNVRKSAQTC